MARGGNKGVDIKLDGAKELRRFFEEAPKLAKKGIRRAITKASTPVTRAAKKNAPRETGLLKKSITKRIKSYPSGNVVAVIGASRAVSGTVTDMGSGGNNKVRQHRKRVPANYIHLVEKGHGGPYTAKPHPFLNPALQQTAQQAHKIAEATLREVVEKEIARLAAKGK